MKTETGGGVDAATPPADTGTIEANRGQDSPVTLPEILVRLDLASPEEVPPAVAVFDASLFIEPGVVRLLPAVLARKYGMLPLKADQEHLLVATGRTLEAPALLEDQLAADLKLKLIVAPETEVQEAVERCYRRVSQIGFQQMRLGEILLARGVISHQQLDSALEEQAGSGGKLGETLVRLKYATEEMIYSALAEKLGYQYKPVSYVEIDHEVSHLVSRRFAENHLVLPTEIDSATDELVVAMANPQDLAVADLLGTVCRQRGLKLRTVLSTPGSIRQGVAYTYHSGSGERRQGEIEMETVSSATEGRAELVLTSEMPKIKKIINSVLYQAVKEGASDIHIENLESRVRVRFRIDGILQLRSTPITKDNIGPLISVLKIDSGLDITERRRPQDGVFKKRIGKDWYIDFRLNVHCTQFGPDAVIRVLDTTKKLPKLDQLGLPEDTLSVYLKLVNNPQGLILITGPTGSGKSTTLYSTLSHLNLAERKIVTAEDPIEYHLDGICQYQVNDQLGNTFGEYGRRFLRKDPDVILIGETRDEITADACLRAAMTGHLVFSTLHTNHATGAVARLRDLGADSSSIADGLLAVMAQRLIRRNCRKCLQTYQPGPDVLEEFHGESPPSGIVYRRGTGCHACGHTGYHDRLGVYEFWRIDRRARRAILANANEEELAGLAEDGGMTSLVADAMGKVNEGVTTLEELLRVLPMDQIRKYARRFSSQAPGTKRRSRPARA